jgi:hypothetical protein
MIRAEQIIDGIKKIRECPECHGEGGYTEVITDDGMGSHYKCGFCNGKGTINVFRKLYFLVWFKIWELYDEKQREKGLPKRKRIASARTRNKIIKRIAEYFHNDPGDYRLTGNEIFFNRKGRKGLVIGFWVSRKWGWYQFESFMSNGK